MALSSNKIIIHHSFIHSLKQSDNAKSGWNVLKYINKQTNQYIQFIIMLPIY